MPSNREPDTFGRGWPTVRTASRWIWGSTRGGVTRRPPRSMVSAAVVSSPTATITPRFKPRSVSVPCPVTRALRRIRSIIWPSWRTGRRSRRSGGTGPVSGRPPPGFRQRVGCPVPPVPGRLDGISPDDPHLTGLLVRRHPDVALVHQLDLPVDDLAPVLRVVVGSPIEVEVLRVDRPLVDQLILLGGQVLDPVVPLGTGAEPAQRLDVDGAVDPGRAAAVIVS